MNLTYRSHCLRRTPDQSFPKWYPDRRPASHDKQNEEDEWKWLSRLQSRLRTRLRYVDQRESMTKEPAIVAAFIVTIQYATAWRVQSAAAGLPQSA